QHTLARLDPHTNYPGIVRAAERHARGDPAAEGFVLLAATPDADAAAVRRLSRCLAKQQTLLGCRWEHAPAPRFLRQCRVVRRRVGPEHGQLETVLAFRLAVAAGGVAAVAAQQRDDVGFKVEVLRRGIGERRTRPQGREQNEPACARLTVSHGVQYSLAKESAGGRASAGGSRPTTGGRLSRILIDSLRVFQTGLTIQLLRVRRRRAHFTAPTPSGRPSNCRIPSLLNISI